MASVHRFVNASDLWTRSRPGGYLLAAAIVLSALVLALPCLISGIPVDGDAITHIQYQHHFSAQFWGGEPYPRWLMNSNKGYGSPIFILQYPLPYWLTALIRPVTRFRSNTNRESRELGVFCFLALASAAVAAWHWLGKRFSPVPAAAGAILYIGLPYTFAFELYKSAAIGQLCAAIWMPLALSACESLRPRLISLSRLAIFYALLVLSNPITAALFLPLLAGYAVACGQANWIPIRKRLVSLSLAIVLSIGVAGVYLVPMTVYRSLFDLAAWSYLIPSYFSFVRVSSVMVPRVTAALGSAAVMATVSIYILSVSDRPLRWRFMLAVPLVAGALMEIPDFGPNLIRASGFQMPVVYGGEVHHPENMLATALSMMALGVLAYCTLSDRVVSWREHALVLGACASFLLMLPLSAVVWHASANLAAAIQFPHRFGAILTLAVTGLFAAAVEYGAPISFGSRTLSSRTVLTAAAIAAISLGAFAWRTDGRWLYGLRSSTSYSFDASRDVDWMYRVYVVPRDIDAVSAMLGVTNGEIRATSPASGDANLVKAHGSLSVLGRGPRELSLSYLASEPLVIRIQQLYSPLWKAVLDRQIKSVRPITSDRGLVEVAVPPGRHKVAFKFAGGWPEWLGAGLTAASLLTVLWGLLAGLSKNYLHVRGVTRGREEVGKLL